MVSLSGSFRLISNAGDGRDETKMVVVVVRIVKRVKKRSKWGFIFLRVESESTASVGAVWH